MSSSVTNLTASADSNLYIQGMDVFWKLVKSQIQNRHEAALALIHWILIDSGFRCIGRDSELPGSEDPSRTGSEVLPDGWNDRSNGFYSLLYFHPQEPRQMFLLKLIPVCSITDGSIMGNLLILHGTPEVVSFELTSHRFIPENWLTASSPSVFPEFKSFLSFIKSELVDKVSPPPAKSAHVGSGNNQQPRQPFITGSGSYPGSPGVHPPSQPYVPQPLPAPPLREFVPPSSHHNPFALGSRDLDPFRGFGGNVIGPGHFLPSGGMPGFGGGGLVGIPYRYDPPGPPELMPFGLGNDPSGIGQILPRRQTPQRAPLQPGEPNPDHQRPPPGPGDDLNNMFM